MNEHPMMNIQDDTSMLTNGKLTIRGRPVRELSASACSTGYFHSGNKEKDVLALIDMAYDIVEIWNVEQSPYNQVLKKCWLKRAKELGAIPLLGEINNVSSIGFLDKFFLECGEDGVVRVKDGRTLEEYINDPRIVARRAKAKKLPCEMAICSKEVFEMGVLGQYSCA